MAFIIGLSDNMAPARLREAGYDLITAKEMPAIAEILSNDTNLTRICIFVDCEPEELLTPPFCKNCHSYMGESTNLHNEQDGGTIANWGCDNCGWMCEIEWGPTSTIAPY